jgi:hypothetical protein
VDWLVVGADELPAPVVHAQAVRPAATGHLECFGARVEEEALAAHRDRLDRRLDSAEKIATEVAAWESKRNTLKARIHWTFTLAVARRKLRKLYPSNEG